MDFQLPVGSKTYGTLSNPYYTLLTNLYVTYETDFYLRVLSDSPFGFVVFNERFLVSNSESSPRFDIFILLIALN